MTTREPEAPKPIRGANDNAPGAQIAPEPPPPRAYPSATPEELKLMHGVLSALAQMAANDLCATTLCSGEP